MLVNSFFTGLSGLQVNSRSLNVIGENLANANTVGFKKNAAQFSEVLGQITGSTAGNGNPINSGMGARVNVTQNSFAQGSFIPTGIKTNLAIQGSGFFVMSNGIGPSFSRAGNMTLNSEGFIQDPSGLNLMGFAANANGSINFQAGLQPMRVPIGFTANPQITSEVRFQTNLNAVTPTGGTYSTSVEIYDSLGIPHSLNLLLTKTANPGEWDYQFEFPDGTVSTTAPTQGDGTITFDANGNLSLLDGLSIQDPAIANRTIGLDNINTGANNMIFTWDLIDINLSAPNVGRFSQYGAPNSTGTVFQDGFGSGQLQDMEIDQDGIVTGLFSNGLALPIGQVALATFNNNHGLRKLAENQYLATFASGPASVDVPGSGGRGGIISRSLEQSNVDISEEFTNMIVGQRGYQSNSKIITTVDSLFAESLNLKR